MPKYFPNVNFSLSTVLPYIFIDKSTVIKVESLLF